MAQQLDAGVDEILNSLQKVMSVSKPQALPDTIHSLNLTPQEQFLYQYHLNNLHNAPVFNKDGSVSTLRQMIVGGDGKYYNIPSVFGGAAHNDKEALENARRIGLDKFPSYPSIGAAQDRYDAMHKYMDQEIGQFLRSRKK